MENNKCNREDCRFCIRTWCYEGTNEDERICSICKKAGWIVKDEMPEKIIKSKEIV